MDGSGCSDWDKFATMLLQGPDCDLSPARGSVGEKSTSCADIGDADMLEDIDIGILKEGSEEEMISSNRSNLFYRFWES